MKLIQLNIKLLKYIYYTDNEINNLKIAII